MQLCACSVKPYRLLSYQLLLSAVTKAVVCVVLSVGPYLKVSLVAQWQNHRPMDWWVRSSLLSIRSNTENVCLFVCLLLLLFIYLLIYFFVLFLFFCLFVCLLFVFVCFCLFFERELAQWVHHEGSIR